MRVHDSSKKRIRNITKREKEPTQVGSENPHLGNQRALIVSSLQLNCPHTGYSNTNIGSIQKLLGSYEPLCYSGRVHGLR